MIFILHIKRPLISLVLALAIAANPLFAAAREDDSGDFRVDLLNSVELSPERPGSDELNDYLDELMPMIISEDMDTYEQVEACFDYVRDNTRYGSHVANLDAKVGDTTCRAISRQYGVVEGYGAVALAARVGMCNAYASAFILMARKVGLKAYLVKGRTKGSGGGYQYHEWAEIKIGDVRYIFDPQLDQSLTKAGLGEHSVFCVTYDQVPGRYVKS